MNEIRLPHICCSCAKRSPSQSWLITSPSKKIGGGNNSYVETSSRLKVPVCDQCFDELSGQERRRKVAFMVLAALGALIGAGVLVYIADNPSGKVLAASIGSAVGAAAAVILCYVPVNSLLRPNHPAKLSPYGSPDFRNQAYAALYRDANFGHIYRIVLAKIEALETVGETDEIYCVINGRREAESAPTKNTLMTIHRQQSPSSWTFGVGQSGPQDVRKTVAEDQAVGDRFSVEVIRRDPSGNDMLVGRVSGEITQSGANAELTLREAFEKQGQYVVTTLAPPETRARYKLYFVFESR